MKSIATIFGSCYRVFFPQILRRLVLADFTQKILRKICAIFCVKSVRNENVRQYAFGLLFLLISSTLYAQAPQAINYQAVARDNQGKPIPSKPVAIQISILDGSVNGNTVYAETHQKTTNQFGLFTLAIGQGSVQSGSFGAIDWAGGDKFLKVNIDNTLQGTTQLLSVPYALYAAKAKEGQTLSVNGNQLSISEGNTVTLPASGGGGTLNDLSDVNTGGVSNGQVLQWNGNQWVPTNPVGDNWGSQAVQTAGNALSGNGTSGSPLALAQQGAANGQVLKWNGSQWAPDNDLNTVGSGNAATASPVTGDGSAGSPIRLIPGSANGQVLKWNGSAWTLATDETGSGGNNYTAGPGINITGNSPNFTVINTGDINPNDDLTTTSQAGGDVSGTFSNLQIGSNTIGTNEITNGSVQAADLAAGVIPVTLPPSGVAGGDLSGVYPNPTLAKIQGKPVAATAPVDGQVLRYNGTTQQWEPVTQSNGGSGWGLTGNSGTDPAVNFIGTTDGQPIAFRVNGEERMRLWGDGRLELFGEDTTNTFVGKNAGIEATPGLPNSWNGKENTFFGTNAGYSNTTGSLNTAVGFKALYSNEFGQANNAFGYRALFSNISGCANDAWGYLALRSNTTGCGNTAFGWNILSSNTTGDYNVATGGNALQQNTTGNYNIAYGPQALIYNKTGNYNIASGSNALYYNVSGNSNVAIGDNSGPFDSDFSNTIALGFIASPTASNSARIGNTSITSIGGQVNWTAFSDTRFKTGIKEEVKGLDFIRRLRPVTYQYNIEKLDDFLGTTARRSERGDTLSQFEIESREKASSIRYTGFIAQEVEQAARELGFDFSGVDAPDNEKDLYGLRYAEFTVPLVKAVQEQQTIIEAQQEQLKALQEQLASLAAEVRALKGEK